MTAALVLLRAVHDPELVHGVTGTEYLLDGPSLVALGLALSYSAETGTGVLGLAAGPPEWDLPLCEAIGLGADAIARVWEPGFESADVLATARAIAGAVPPETRLVFCGSAATDHGSGLLPAAIAETLGWPVLEDVSAVERAADGLRAQVRPGGGRRLIFAVEPPAVLVAARMHPPAVYPRLARLLAARKTPVRATGPAAESAGSRLRLTGYGPARPRTRQLLRPSASAKPANRLRQLMSGGMGSRSGNTIDASRSDVAGQLAEMLVARGFVG